MKIIESITIRYFRSVYTLTLSPCEDLTVITGKNDVGKSNILKALNLFFCNQSDYLHNFSFLDDYSIIRKEEVRKDTIRGQQFISISVRFLRGNRMPNSLPPSFTVTKRWDMHSQESKTTTDVQERMKVYAQKNGINYSERITTTSLSTFLNKIKYVYIPAIKDERVFSGTLNILQQSLFDSKNKEILDAPIGEANKAVQAVVGELQTDFEKATGIANHIELPNTLNYASGLLQVNTLAPGGLVTIDKRGDGIRTHYIPKILNYVSSHSKFMYIWGFEEPENSYEYRRCIQVASEFEKDYSRNSQIFITSHSPAFFGDGIEGKTIVRIDKSKGKTILISDKIPLEEELGYIEIYKDFTCRVKELEKQTQEKEEQIDALKCRLGNIHGPTLLTEGKTDAALLKIAIKKLGLHEFSNWEIQPILSGKTSNNETLLRFLTDLSGNIHPTTPVIGMFDRDTKLSIKTVNNGETDIRDHEYVEVGDNVFAFSLPVPHNRKETDQISIEHYFTDEEIKTEFNGKRLYLGNEFYETGILQSDTSLFCKDRRKIGTIKIIEHESNCFITKIDGSGDYSLSKARFVECIENNEAGFSQISFNEYSKIFDILHKIIDIAQKPIEETIPIENTFLLPLS